MIDKVDKFLHLISSQIWSDLNQVWAKIWSTNYPTKPRVDLELRLRPYNFKIASAKPDIQVKIYLIDVPYLDTAIITATGQTGGVHKGEVD